MRKYAFIRNNVVQLVSEIEETEYENHVSSWESIIDITDVLPEPKKSWILSGNSLYPVSPDTQQIEQQIFGAALSLELVNKVGSRNLQLSQNGTVVNVTQLLTTLGSVKTLLETGALKTARSIIIAVTPGYPSYADIFTEGSTRISTYLQNKGWD